MDTSSMMLTETALVKPNGSQNQNKSHESGDKTGRDEWGGGMDVGVKGIREGGGKSN